jgi:hypothetical protein
MLGVASLAAIALWPKGMDSYVEQPGAKERSGQSQHHKRAFVTDVTIVPRDASVRERLSVEFLQSTDVEN